MWLAQIALAFAAGEAPVRFGTPVPIRALAEGLALRTPGCLQWRPLPLRPPAADRCWIEVMVVGARGRVRIDLGGHGPSAVTGPALEQGGACDDGVDYREWRWIDGTVDWRRRTHFSSATEVGGEVFTAGEFRSEESAALATRADAAVALPRRVWEQVGLLPRDSGLAAPLRAHLQQAAHALRELPGTRGAGDYARSGGVVTNLEFDTALGLLRLALALGDVSLWQRARRAAWHLADRDLDERTGLPFAHGLGHRDAAPEPGHAWLQGIAWCGAIGADEPLLDAARRIAHAIAASPPAGEGRNERARDFAWPLLELEAWLGFAQDDVVAAAADRLADAIARRFDGRLRTFRFGEGEADGPGYLERGWLTGGIVVPALQAHLRRRPQADLQASVDVAIEALCERIGQGRGGLPTHWRVLPGSVFAEHRAEHDPKAFLLLEALPLRDLQRIVRKPHVLRGLGGTPALDGEDLPTELSMIARCTWVYR